MRLPGRGRAPDGPPPALRPASDVYPAVSELLRRSQRSTDVPLSLDLTLYELKALSQNGEDGVIDEILRRIGTDNRSFVEFGIEGGVEGNCVALADVFGWTGWFLDGDPATYGSLAAKYEMSDRVITAQRMVTPANIEQTFGELGVPTELDVLSIDIDSHEYWVWKALTNWRPRLVVVEYNGHMGTDPVTLPLEHTSAWEGDDYFGASLGALEVVAAEKGYRLVHCDQSGINAFFVRDDLAREHFLPPNRVMRRAPNYGLAGIRHAHREGARWHRVS